MGDAWLPAFLEAPVWRFTLPPGMCGAQAALGLMLPSVDRAGRYFPLTFAALGPHGIAAGVRRGMARPVRSRRTHRVGTGYGAGRYSRCDEDTTDLPDDTTGNPDAVWWSEGSARVKPACMMLRCLPDAATYAAMLGAETERIEPEEREWKSTP